MIIRRGCSAAIYALLSWVGSGSAQDFAGTNSPGGFTDIAFTVGVGATNLSLSVAGAATTFSHLLLKAGATPSNSSFDFRAAQDGQTNAINLELPELLATNYVLRVFTPTNSQTHAFTVSMATNLAGLRSAALPASKPFISATQDGLASGQWHYYRVEIATNLPGWRLRLESAAAQPDLYLQRGQLPTTSNWLKRSLAQTNDLIALTALEATRGLISSGCSRCPARITMR